MLHFLQGLFTFSIVSILLLVVVVGIKATVFSPKDKDDNEE